MYARDLNLQRTPYDLLFPVTTLLLFFYMPSKTPSLISHDIGWISHAPHEVQPLRATFVSLGKDTITIGVDLLPISLRLNSDVLNSLSVREMVSVAISS
jgi:hypothetical protein